MHELANPPIIHRDVKSTNILLDARLNAKVSDFGISKSVNDAAKGYITTQVKGTMVSYLSNPIFNLNTKLSKMFESHLKFYYKVSKCLQSEAFVL